MLGGLLGGPFGVVAGGALGHSAETSTPLPLEAALHAEFTNRGATLVQLYRRGPFRADVLFLSHGRYWTLSTTAPRVPGWQQTDLDDWLFGDLVDAQLAPWLLSHPVAFW